VDSAEAQGLQVVSLWWPREDGAYADFLSHLAVRLDVPSVSGHITAVADLVAAADASSSSHALGLFAIDE
jgi:hypothetical protein